MNVPWQARYWPRVDKRGPDECWPWMANICSTGYGGFSLGGKKVLTHRLAWMLANGPIPPGAWILHRCDNPPCCNPAHLFLGTTADNTRDRDSKGRGARGERVGSSKLTKDQVAEIRRRLATGEFQRLIAADFGVSQVTISHIALGKKWKHVPAPAEETA